MKIRTKPLLSILGVIVIAGVVLRYCAPVGSTVVTSALKDRKSGQSISPSHAQAKAVDVLSAFANEFKTPIELYGKVIDQHGDQVPGATVTLTPVDAPTGDTSQSETVLASDAAGEFSIKGLHGFSMGVHVKKEGYLDIPPLGGPASSAMISYSNGAEQGKRHSHPETPLVLKLHKVGQMEPMLYVADRWLRLPVDGTARSIALDSVKGLGSHQIEFRFKTGWVNIPADNEHFGDQFDWSFEARIPGGGFIWCYDEYNIDAPEFGYLDNIRLEYKTNMFKEQWQKMVYGSFFVKFADGSHGRIRFCIDGMERDGDSPLKLASWLNLKPGSRNLATNQVSISAASSERYKKEWK